MPGRQNPPLICGPYHNGPGLHRAFVLLAIDLRADRRNVIRREVFSRQSKDIHAARLRRTEPAGHDPVREVRPASAAWNGQSERYRREGIDLSVSTWPTSGRLHDGPATRSAARTWRSISANRGCSPVPNAGAEPGGRHDHEPHGVRNAGGFSLAGVNQTGCRPHTAIRASSLLIRLDVKITHHHSQALALISRRPTSCGSSAASTARAPLRITPPSIRPRINSKWCR